MVIFWIFILDYILKIKKVIVTEKFDDSKILIDADHKWSDEITFKNVMILITYMTKDDDKFYLQLFLELNCLMNKHGNNMS